jgi:hypothetical protein
LQAPPGPSPTLNEIPDVREPDVYD